jgi:hypothetical protein
MRSKMKINNPQNPNNIHSPSPSISKEDNLKNSSVSKTTKPDNIESITKSSSNDPLTGDLVSMLNSGEIDTKKAVSLLVDRLVKQSGVDNNEQMRSFMLDQIKNDPGLKALADQMGIDPDLL